MALRPVESMVKDLAKDPETVAEAAAAARAFIRFDHTISTTLRLQLAILCEAAARGPVGKVQ